MSKDRLLFAGFMQSIARESRRIAACETSGGWLVRSTLARLARRTVRPSADAIESAACGEVGARCAQHPEIPIGQGQQALCKMFYVQPQSRTMGSPAYPEPDPWGRRSSWSLPKAELADRLEIDAARLSAGEAPLGFRWRRGPDFLGRPAPKD